MQVDLDVDTNQLKQQVRDLKQAAKALVDKADAILEALNEPLVVTVTPVQPAPPPA